MPVPAFRLSICLLPALLLVACGGDPEPRRYQEILTRGEGANLQRDPVTAMRWILPEGWLVQPEGDPLRLTGFWVPDAELSASGQPDARAVDVSIVQLAGDAGGLKANVTRWLGQVKISAAFADEALATARPVRTASGHEGVVVDFTGMLSGDLTQSQSIIGAIIDAGNSTVFVKAMGEKTRVVKMRPQLLEFCRGLVIGEDGTTDDALRQGSGQGRRTAEKTGDVK